MTTMPVRVEAELFAAASSAAAVSRRSAAQQINHWARLGRELEASPHLSIRDIEDVLAGSQSYDSLDDRAQAVVRADWDESIAARLAGLDLSGEFMAAGVDFATADDAGTVTATDA